MRKLLLMTVVLFISSIGYSQSTFEKDVKRIKREIATVTKKEKLALQVKVEEINKELDQKSISEQEATSQKQVAAEECAKNIQEKVEVLENELQALVQKEVDSVTVTNDADSPDEEYETTTANLGKTSITFNFPKERNKVKEDKYKYQPRTTSHGVFAFGLNNVVTDGGLSTIENNGIKISNSRFYEWGLAWRTRISANSSILAVKYGLSLTYNNLRPENNFYFEKSGNQTNLVNHPSELRDEPYFRMTNLVVPIHLEFDFTKSRKTESGKSIVRSGNGVRIGIGGYGGINTRTKQIEEYSSNGQKVDKSTRGDFNTSSIIYGLSGYVGYGSVSIYTKYDINPLFTDNAIQQNNISVGIRFDFD